MSSSIQRVGPAAGTGLSCLCVLAFCMACGRGEPAPGAGVSDSAATGGAVADRELVLIDSIGVELGDSCYVFGSIESVSHGPDGDIYVMDRVMSCVRRYTPDGDFVLQYGKLGSGPGEMTNPLSMATLNEAGVAVCAAYQGGIHLYSYDGEWQGLRAGFSNNPPLYMVGAGDSSYIASKLTIEAQEGQPVAEMVVGRYRVDSTEPDVVYRSDSFLFDPSDLSEFLRRTFFAYVYTADSRGNVYVAPYSTEDYLIQCFSPDGELIRTISMDVPRVERSEEEIQEEADFVNTRVRNMGAQGVAFNYRPEPYRQMVTGLGVDAEGNLWARRGTESVPFFDVFDPADGSRLYGCVLRMSPSEGPYYTIIVDEGGFLAYHQNPEGFQKLYLLGLD
ncbi:hypothetical protein JW921_08760 [Candidatus Fermentibacterales bacterium]|nr:hypothetical protein [Candidatus Fermentibacterales bacterium]